MRIILEVQKLTLRVSTGHVLQTKKKILGDISFEVEQGKATAYLGPNGAGKTSTFRILCGLCRPDSGEIRFAGQEITSKLPSSQVGFMPEQPYFYRHLSARELLEALGSLSGMPAADRRSSIIHWAERLDFGHVLDQRLSQCSKGQVQRIGLAQALMHRPRFLLLDEPMSGLDPLGRETVKEVLRDVVHEGTSLLFSSHILSDAESLCENVIILNRGKVLHQGDICELTQATDAWDIEVSGPALPGISAQPITRDSWRVTVESLSRRNEVLKEILQDPNRLLLNVSKHKLDLETAFVRLIKEGKA